MGSGTIRKQEPAILAVVFSGYEDASLMMGLCSSGECPGGEIGRRKGLKILFRASGVRVQVPPRAPFSSHWHQSSP